MTHNPLSAASFDAMYQAAADPWNFSSSPYEQGRCDEILKALAGRMYNRAFEPGCSIGILTERLASICARLDASDISSVAVERARLRCGSLSNVSIEVGSLPDSIPPGLFDLVVLSEIGYYFSASELFSLTQKLVSRLTRNGVLLGAHWLGDSQDHILSGDRVHDILSAASGLKRIGSLRFEGFRIDRWRRD